MISITLLEKNLIYATQQALVSTKVDGLSKTHDNIVLSTSLFLVPRFGKRYGAILGGLGVGPERVSKLLRSHCNYWIRVFDTVLCIFFTRRSGSSRTLEFERVVVQPPPLLPLM